MLMNVLAELKRRNVIRMGGLYLVGAWLLLQIAATLSPMLGAPEWVGRTVLALLAFGFVPALVFSWVYELTPDGFKRDADVQPGESIAPQTAQRMDRLIFAGVLALVLVIAADRWLPRADRAAPAGQPVTATDAAPTEALAAATTEAPMAIDPNSIAVLPFVNMSADADNEYFSDGISEELLNALVTVDGLSVASRTSSFAFKGREMGTAAIGSELRVAHVLEGSVRKAGNRVRITAQLIDAASDRHLWSQTFDRELTDIFAIQDEIAKAIVAALRDTLGEQAPAAAVEVRADTTNLQAYDLYLKARELFIARNRLDESVRLFEQVVALDPGFARGWEGLAASSAVIVDWSANYPSLDVSGYRARAAEAADRALALDPTLSMPWATRALVLLNQSPTDNAAVLALLDRALAADPRNSTAYLWRGIQWMRLGFFDRAHADLDRCLQIDPAYGNCLRWKALATLLQGHTEAALALYEQGMAAGFNDNRSDSFIAPLIRRGDSFAAIMLMRGAGFPVEIQQAVVSRLRDGKPPADAGALLRRQSSTEQYFPLALLLGDYALAAESMGSVTTVQQWDPGNEGLRGSPAFKRMVERTNAPAYWREHGFPPQCRPLPGDDFECDPPADQP